MCRLLLTLNFDDCVDICILQTASGSKPCGAVAKMPPLEDDDIDMNEGLSEPGRPTVVEVSDFDATTATLKWRAPDEDGGAPIKEYLVDTK